jgi:uncharacterized protein YfcZ (UPF0381/DUF406 family)
MENIQYLLHHQIDKKKWDDCIDTAINGLIYGYSFYLDAMAKNWCALILNDYEMVMPLPWNKKFCITYLYTPNFLQQLGIFSKIIITEQTVNAFVSAVKKKFKFAELFVNFKIGEAQPNFILPLHQSFDLIQQGYKNDLKKNLKHAAKFSLTYKKADDFIEAIDIYKRHYADRVLHVKQKDYSNFSRVCEVAKKKGFLQIRKVFDEKQEVLAIALFFKDKRRLYNVMSSVTQKGRQCEANHYLFNNLIQEFSGEKIVLDFEGSSIPGIASFYKLFGGINEPYFFIRYNNLPWPLKYFK